MKKDQGPVLLGLAALGALAFWYFSKQRASAAPARSARGNAAAGGGAGVQPLLFAGGTPVAPLQRPTQVQGAPVPSLTTALALQGANTLGSILSHLVSPSTSTGSGGGLSLGGGGGAGGSHGPGGGRAPAPVAPTFRPTPSAPSFGSGGGGVNPGSYYTDPSTGITYDLNSGEAVSGVTIDPGIAYSPGDQPTSVDMSGDSGSSNDWWQYQYDQLGLGNSGDSSQSDQNFWDQLQAEEMNF